MQAEAERALAQLLGPGVGAGRKGKKNSQNYRIVVQSEAQVSSTLWSLYGHPMVAHVTQAVPLRTSWGTPGLYRWYFSMYPLAMHRTNSSHRLRLRSTAVAVRLARM